MLSFFATYTKYKMTNKEIIELPTFLEMRPHLVQLKVDYEALTGKRVCMSCGNEVHAMINYFKRLYMETQFQLTKPFVMYKLQKGDKRLISNDIMTDELALEFLRIDPQRIRVFNRYPENWKELLEGGSTEDVDKEDVDKEDVKDSTITAESLDKMRMQDLRDAYPDVPKPFGQKKAELIQAIIEANKK